MLTKRLVNIKFALWVPHVIPGQQQILWQIQVTLKPLKTRKYPPEVHPSAELRLHLEVSVALGINLQANLLHWWHGDGSRVGKRKRGMQVTRQVLMPHFSIKTMASGDIHNSFGQRPKREWSVISIAVK